MHPLPATGLAVDALVGDLFLERVTRTIVEHLRPRRIVLFGSRARGDAREDSDYDVMVELETDLPTDVAEDVVYDLLSEDAWSVEVCVYTPGEIRRWQDDVGTIVYDIVREGRVLYTAPDIAVDDPSGMALSRARVSEGPRRVPESVATWIRQAQGDFDAMRAAERWERPLWDAVCFHAHQCCEKLLKASLIAKSIDPPRTHDLRKLLHACNRAGFDFHHLRGPCTTLQRLYPRSRYPRGKALTGREGKSAIAAATVSRSAILPVLGEVT